MPPSVQEGESAVSLDYLLAVHARVGDLMERKQEQQARARKHG